MKIHIKDVHGKPKEVHYEKLELSENGQVKCLECNKTYSSIQTARVHRKYVHMSKQNDRKFICKLCNKDFAVKGYMKRHVKTVHTSPTAFKCVVCPKNFKLKRSLDSHMNNCHGVYHRLNCLECDTFLDEIGLKRHMRKVHLTTIADPWYFW